MVHAFGLHNKYLKKSENQKNEMIWDNTIIEMI